MKQPITPLLEVGAGNVGPVTYDTLVKPWLKRNEIDPDYIKGMTIYEDRDQHYLVLRRWEMEPLALGQVGRRVASEPNGEPMVTTEFYVVTEPPSISTDPKDWR